jgi:hypothetical protein
VTLRARWVTLRARWVTLRAHWVTLRAVLGDVESSLGDAKSCWDGLGAYFLQGARGSSGGRQHHRHRCAACGRCKVRHPATLHLRAACSSPRKSVTRKHSPTHHPPRFRRCENARRNGVSSVVVDPDEGAGSRESLRRKRAHLLSFVVGWLGAAWRGLGAAVEAAGAERAAWRAARRRGEEVALSCGTRLVGAARGGVVVEAGAVEGVVVMGSSLRLWVEASPSSRLSRARAAITGVALR